MAWTEDKNERLKTLWAAGETATAIADKLGGDVSRNAVLGQARRLGLESRAKAGAGRRLSAAFERVIELMGRDEEEGWTLPSAARKVGLPLTEVRTKWAQLMARYDFGQGMTMSDDTPRPVRP